jgi:alpha-tubulin suppressor-like RCC1 family protein
VQRRGDAAPWCFGNFHWDQYVEGPHGSLLPARVPSLADSTELALGTVHQCGIDGAGALRCEGDNAHGSLGTNAFGATESAPLRDGVSALSAGPMHACAVRAGRVLCWGANDAAELGLGLWLHLDEAVSR